MKTFYKVALWAFIVITVIHILAITYILVATIGQLHIFTPLEQLIEDIINLLWLISLTIWALSVILRENIRANIHTIKLEIKVQELEQELKEQKRLATFEDEKE